MFALILFGACHSDANVPDAPFVLNDAEPDGAEGPAVTITVSRDGVPQPGVIVYFGDDGKLDPGTKHVTDASGIASSYVESGMYHNAVVTVINPFGPIASDTDELFTFADVQPGDRLQLSRTTPPSVSISVMFPSDASATTYRLHTNCGHASPTSGATVMLHGCGPSVDMLLETLDVGGNSKNWIYRPDVAVTEGGTVSFSGPYQPAATSQLAFETLNVVSSQIQIHTRLATEKGIVYDGAETTMPISFMNNHPVIDMTTPSIAGSTTITDVSFGYTEYDQQHFVDWYPAASTHSFDLTAGGLVSFASEVTFNRATRYLEYANTGGTVAPDVLRTRIELGDTAGRKWQWHAVAPYGKPRYPTLPTDVYNWNTGSAASAEVLEATLLTIPGGYEGLRANAFSLTNPSQAYEGAAGRLYYETPAP
ncbi:MAG: hypothetical protein AB7O24_26525 [Kofleriaceae bacterium]